MKKTIKITAFMLSLFMLLALCACGGDKEEETTQSASIFSKTDLSEYVILGKYKGIPVDISESDFDVAKKGQLSNDISENGLEAQACYTEPLYTGKVQNGDIANIDYEGKKDGVAFEGGTSQGHDLTIGSHSFIDGFEDGLIGVSVGDTVDLDLTFPENYGSAELAGAAVVFTVKVNSVRTPDPEKIYSQLGFETVEEYKENLDDKTKKSLVVDRVVDGCKITGIPKKDVDILFKARCDYNDMQLSSTGNTFEEALKSYNMTLDSYKEQILSTLQSEVKSSMIYYSILKAEGLKKEYDLPDREKKGQSVLDEMTKVKHIVEDFISKNSTVTITE